MSLSRQELDTLWPAAEVSELRERLHEARDAEAKLRVFEDLLLPRCTGTPLLHPAVVDALRALPHTAKITELVTHSGYSHRAFCRARSLTDVCPTHGIGCYYLEQGIAVTEGTKLTLAREQAKVTVVEVNERIRAISARTRVAMT